MKNYYPGEYSIAISPDRKKLGLMKGDVLIARIYLHSCGRIVMDSRSEVALTAKSVELALSIMKDFYGLRKKLRKEAGKR